MTSIPSKVVSDLMLGAIFFEEGLGINAESDGGRAGIIISLEAAINTLYFLKVSDHQIWPLKHLLESLQYLELGTVADCFKTSEIYQGRPRLNQRELMFQASAIALMNLFLKEENKVKMAAARATHLLHKAGFYLAPNATLSDEQTLINWRKKLHTNKENHVHDLLLKQFHDENFTIDENSLRLVKLIQRQFVGIRYREKNSRE